MSVYRIFLCSIFALASLLSNGQDSVYARKIMLTLGSPSFSGRGYVQDGIDTASGYIRSEFQRIGLKPIDDTYIQELLVPVNNFTEVKLTLGDSTLKPGYDFILDAHSGTVSGEYDVVTIGESIRSKPKKLKKIAEKSKGKILLLSRYETKDKEALIWYDNIAYANPYQAAGIVVLDSTGFSYSVALYKKIHNGWFCAHLAPHAFPKESVSKASCTIKNDARYYPVNNVWACLQGQEYPDSFIVVSAHYDHIGMLGDALFPGGNDNASGVAMMLDLAKQIQQQRFRPKYSVVFVAFAAEEAGLFGSTYFVEHPPFDLKKIKFLINLDMVGTGSTGITVVNGSVFKNHFQKLVDINNEAGYIAGVKERGEACNSDHCPFYKAGVPSFFIYTTGKEYSEYHTVNDKPENVPMTAYNGLFRLIEAFIYSF